MGIQLASKSNCDSLRCTDCSIHEFCIAHGVDASNAPHKPLQRYYLPETIVGAHIHWAGDAFRNLYVVKSGCVKAYTVDQDGNERVRGFYLPGDLIGLDAVYTGVHPSSTCAVVPSHICAIPYSQLTRTINAMPAMQGRLMSLMSKDLLTALSLCGDFTAEQRLAAFFLHLEERERERHLVEDNHIELLMSRRDIASYLRLAPETVSRVLGRFAKFGWIVSRPKEILISNRAALTVLAEPLGLLAPARDLAVAA